MPLGERSPPQIGVISPVFGSTVTDQPRYGTTDLPSASQNPTLSVTQARPAASNFGPKANSW
jgi:hypothetical protein